MREETCHPFHREIRPKRKRLEFQQLLFGDDAEAQAQEAARLAALDYTEARKLAWSQGKPFPEDETKWYAAHRDLTNARCRETYQQNYAAVAESYLQGTARYRAEQLGCKIGRRGPILKIYAKAVHASVLLCYWCKKLTRPGERHVDHKQPLAAGGAHVAGNLCITCAECNLVKGDTEPNEFRQMVAAKRIANGLIAAEYFRWVLKAASPSA
jgi:5-methylcytosine-specific restriction endonuclease McrA